MNNSSTGGVLLPHPKVPVLVTAPQNLTLTEFIQTILVGFSGLNGTFVRPEWQSEEPFQPDISVNWVAFGVKTNSPDANAYQSVQNGIVSLQRQETLTIGIMVYGPNAMDNIALIRDGFEIPQNLASLKAANMGYVDITDAQHIPDLINERWCDRYVCDIVIHRCIQRTYPILDFVSVSGTIYSQTASNPNYQNNFVSGE